MKKIYRGTRKLKNFYRLALNGTNGKIYFQNVSKNIIMKCIILIIVSLCFLEKRFIELY